MSGWRKAAIWISIVIVPGVVIAFLRVKAPPISREKMLDGAVLVANVDPRKQLPIPNVEITAEAGGRAAGAKSDSSGFYRLKLPSIVLQGAKVTLRFRHPDYQPLEITQPLGDRLYIARMAPSTSVPSTSVQGAESDGAEISVADIRVRYSVKATTTINIGSAVRTLDVVNIGNVPCESRPPCSPDGKWKAAIGSLSLKAGDAQEFQNVRVSCIAGPCSFTKLESDGFARGGPAIDVSVRAWSDTVTFLVEAEVVHTMFSDAIRQAYPSIFGSDMTFTLPPTGQGPSIEAEVDGLEIVFPLGPDLSLSWAACRLQVTANGAKLYSCKLKPGYRFR